MSNTQPKPLEASQARRPIRTLIVDDSPVALESLRLFLGTDEGCELAGSGQSGREAVELAATLHPDPGPHRVAGVRRRTIAGLGALPV